MAGKMSEASVRLISSTFVHVKAFPMYGGRVGLHYPYIESLPTL